MAKQGGGHSAALSALALHEQFAPSALLIAQRRTKGYEHPCKNQLVRIESQYRRGLFDQLLSAQQSAAN
jgi:hypothetical protein